MKKPAIICLIFACVVASVFVFFVLNPLEKKKNNPPVESVVPTAVVTAEPSIEPIVEQTVAPTVEPTPQVVEKIITKEISAVKAISESSLVKYPQQSYEEVAKITGKRLLLIDESVESQNSKMLTYCFDLSVGSRNMIAFVTKSVYSKYNIDDNLNISYIVYTNDIGIEFPIVLSLTDIN